MFIFELFTYLYVFIFSYLEFLFFFSLLHIFFPPNNGFTKTPRMANTTGGTGRCQVPVGELMSPCVALPRGFVLDAATGDIRVADQLNHRVSFWAKDAENGRTIAGGRGSPIWAPRNLVRQETGKRNTPKVISGKSQRCNLMFWGLLSKLKGRNVSVAALGVLFTPENRFVISKEVGRSPRRPKYMCKMILVICWW